MHCDNVIDVSFTESGFVCQTRDHLQWDLQLLPREELAACQKWNVYALYGKWTDNPQKEPRHSHPFGTTTEDSFYYCVIIISTLMGVKFELMPQLTCPIGFLNFLCLPFPQQYEELFFQTDPPLSG